MGKGKDDARKKDGAAINAKTKHILKTKMEFHCNISKGFKGLFLNGTVLFWQTQSKNGGCIQTLSTCIYNVAAFRKETKELLSNKVLEGKAPEAKPPPPNSQIVTPAKMSTLNPENFQPDYTQTTLQWSPLENAFIMNPEGLPSGFIPEQYMLLAEYNEAKRLQLQFLSSPPYTVTTIDFA